MPRLERILIGADFSPGGNAAARWICRHLLPDAAVELVHVLAAEPRPSFAGSAPPGGARETNAAAAAALDALRALARETCPGAELRVVEGRPADELARAAERCSLVAVGEHRQAHGVFNILGSTAEQLARCGPVPVLLARSLPEAAPRRILAAIDDSPLGSRVLCWADAFAERLAVPTTVLYALPRIHAHLRLVSSVAASERVDRELMAAAQRWLEQRIAESAPAGRLRAASVVEGDPAQEILTAARKLGAELIVLGSRGAGAFNRAVVGSVAQSVLRGAACPVLVVSRRTRD